MKLSIKPSAVLEKVSKITLYGLVVLIPLWFLPITQNILDFQKQALMVVLLTIGIIAWLLTTVSKKELVLNSTYLNWFILFLISVSLLATITSVWRYGS